MKATGKVLLIGIILVATSFVVLTSPVYATGTSVHLAAPLDGIPTVTADVIATSGEIISGTVDATGTDIGVYVGPGVSDVTIEATVYGATIAGVYSDQGSSTVTVTGSTIYQIGNHASDGSFAPNGVQYGWGIIFGPGVTGTSAITDNNIYEYQKGGIVVHDFTGPITGNTVTGNGPVTNIAANGIQVGSPSVPISGTEYTDVTGNTITGNIYTGNGVNPGGPWVDTGLMLFSSGGSYGHINSFLHVNNDVHGNQVNVYVYIG